jgi:hypothetical protein
MTRIKINVVKGFTVEEVFQGEPPDHLPAPAPSTWRAKSSSSTTA